MISIRNTRVLYVVLALALALAVLFALTPMAYASNHRSDDVTITNTNNATVTNNVDSEADTGDNTANGGDGDDGGDGGDATGNNGRRNGGTNTAGDGGNGGDGGMGGIINTGNALSAVIIDNGVNSNNTEVEGCGCPGRSRRHGDIVVTNDNDATINNDVESEAETGDNVANGGDGDDGGNGGDATGNNGRRNRGTNTGGAGGNGGDGAGDGRITTGDAASAVVTVNRVNKTFTRAQR